MLAGDAFGYPIRDNGGESLLLTSQHVINRKNQVPSIDRKINRLCHPHQKKHRIQFRLKESLAAVSIKPLKGMTAEVLSTHMQKIVLHLLERPE